MDIDENQMIESESEEEDEKSLEANVNESNDEDSMEDEDDDEEDKQETEIKMLKSLLDQNPYDYATHITLIEKLQKMGELDRLRAAREDMCSKFPLSPELWLSWLRDEIKLATTPEQKVAVETLCEKAVKDYLSIEIWLEYLQFSIGNMGTDKDAATKVRDLFQRALTASGIHVIKGAIIWEAFREFEKILISTVDSNDENQKKEQIDRVGNLFRRQLTCPLLDMEKTFEEYETWKSGEGSISSVDYKIVKSGYERALAALKARLPFEEKLVSSQGENETLDAYKGYLMNEKQNGDPSRVCILYERAVADLSLDTSIWLDYLNYLETNIKIEDIIEQIYVRAIRNVPWCSKIWQNWIRFYEKWNKPALDVQALLENALAAGFSNAEDYRNVWLTYLEYQRRRIDLFSEDEENQIEILRNTFNRACEHLAKSFGLEGDPSCAILQYWARTEAIHCNDMEKARSLWADILSQGHSASASSWLEYISLERCYGDTKHLRKLFQKALQAVKDWPESIANAWLNFERDEGTLEQLELCETKSKERLDKVSEERLEAQQQYSAPYQDSFAPHTKKGSKRLMEESGKWKNLNVIPEKKSKVEKTTVVVNRSNFKKKDNHDIASATKIAPPPGYKDEEENMDVDSHEVDEKITVFVSNLDYSATEEDVQEALKPVGPISLIKMVKDFKGRSKGFCYVQLSSADAVEDALKLDRIQVGNRPMFISRCDSDKTHRGPIFKYKNSLEKNKLFVKGLPVSTTKEHLEEIFKAHGILKEVRLVTYRNGHSKGLAYVEFEDTASASKALMATDGMTIEDKVISVAISKPPERKKVPGSSEAPFVVKSLGGSSVSRTAFGVPKTVLSMIPRTVKTNEASTSGNGVPSKLNNADFRNMLLNKK